MLSERLFKAPAEYCMVLTIGIMRNSSDYY